MRPLTLLSSLVAVLCLAPSLRSVRADEPAPAQRKEQKIEFVRRHYPEKSGSPAVVTEVKKDSITVKCGEETKQFPVCDALAAGKISEPRPLDGRVIYRNFEPYMYRLTDVKVGDWVGIYYARVDGVDVCDHIGIQKRPGGRHPPLPDEVEALLKPKPLPAGWPQPVHITYDEWRNAYWDLEDKGIPYPEKFGRARRFPVAPMPREVKRLAPPISP